MKKLLSLLLCLLPLAAKPVTIVDHSINEVNPFVEWINDGDYLIQTANEVGLLQLEFDNPGVPNQHGILFLFNNGFELDLAFNLLGEVIHDERISPGFFYDYVLNYNTETRAGSLSWTRQAVPDFASSLLLLGFAAVPLLRRR